MGALWGRGVWEFLGDRGKRSGGRNSGCTKDELTAQSPGERIQKIGPGSEIQKMGPRNGWFLSIINSEYQFWKGE